MSKLRSIPFRTYDHGTFGEEWVCHKKSSEWWYATGYLTDEQQKILFLPFLELLPGVYNAKYPDTIFKKKEE